MSKRQETDCKIDQRYPADEPCPRCGGGPCLNGGFTVRVCPHCKKPVVDGSTCVYGGCPMGGDF